MPISSLAIGDRVAVGNGETSDVFAFTHADAEAKIVFVQLFTASGTLTATATHYVHVRRRGMMAAGSVQAGDVLERGDGSAAVVEAVGVASALGLYNPQTLDGNIVVDGFLTSTYTTAVQPGIASALLMPVRALYRAGAPDVLLTLKYGGGWIADWALSSKV
jgi:Hint module